jgi:sugar/nucleoside kinase (ribokinase family)
MQNNISSQQYDVLGIGNAMVDLLYHVPETLLSQHNLQKGSSELLVGDGMNSLMESLSTLKPTIVAGGAVMNSLAIVAQLGGKAALGSAVGDDPFAKEFVRDAYALGVALYLNMPTKVRNGTVLSLVTPDGERTMRFGAEATRFLDGSKVSDATIKASSWVFLEGYILSNGESASQTLLKVAKRAKVLGTKVALTTAAKFIIDVFRKDLDELLPNISMIIANEEEANALTGLSDARASFEQLTTRFPSVVVTMSEKGVLISHDGWKGLVPTSPVKVVDATGAGDAFAGGLLYGLTHGLTAEDSARRAHRLSTAVISQDGARLTCDVKKLWG